MQKIILLLKKFISNLLKIPSVGKAIRLFFDDKIPFSGISIFTDSHEVSNAVVSSIFFRFYESAEVRFVKRYLKPNIPVVELGSSIGVVSCQIAELSNSLIICVEANPKLLPLLGKNLEFNGYKNYKIISGAVDYESKGNFSFFEVGKENVLGRLTKSKNAGTIIVPNITLNKILEENKIDDYILVSDIEGSEIQFLLHDAEALRKCRQMIIELHFSEYENTMYEVNDLLKIISKLGFSKVDAYGNNYVFEKT